MPATRLICGCSDTSAASASRSRWCRFLRRPCFFAISATTGRIWDQSLGWHPAVYPLRLISRFALFWPLYHSDAEIARIQTTRCSSATTQPGKEAPCDSAGRGSPIRTGRAGRTNAARKVPSTNPAYPMCGWTSIRAGVHKTCILITSRRPAPSGLPSPVICNPAMALPSERRAAIAAGAPDLLGGHHTLPVIDIDQAWRCGGSGDLPPIQHAIGISGLP